MKNKKMSVNKLGKVSAVSAALALMLGTSAYVSQVNAETTGHGQASSWHSEEHLEEITYEPSGDVGENSTGTEVHIGQGIEGVAGAINANAQESVGIGKQVSVSHESVAIGNNIASIGESSVAIGTDTNPARDPRSTAGFTNADENQMADGARDAYIIGKNGSKLESLDSEAYHRYVVLKQNPMWRGALVFGNASVGIGSQILILEDEGVALGTSTVSMKKMGTSIGAYAVTNDIRATAVGSNSYAGAVSSVAIGDNAASLSNISAALGADSLAGYDGSVAIGALSRISGTRAPWNVKNVDPSYAEKVGYDPSTGAAKVLPNSDWDRQLLSNYLDAKRNHKDAIDERAKLYKAISDADSAGYKSAWAYSLAPVTVGDNENHLTRRITGVAAGAIDTDAVNVAQLKALVTNMPKIKIGDGEATQLSPNTTLDIKAGDGIKLNKGDDGSYTIAVDPDKLGSSAPAEPTASSADVDKLKTDVEKNTNDIADAKADAKQAQQDAAKAKTNASDANNKADTALSTADTAKNTADNAIGKANTALTDAVDAKNAATRAGQDAIKAKSDADEALHLAKVNKDALDNLGNASELINKLQGDVRDANNATQTAQNAADTAQRAADEANRLASDATKAIAKQGLWTVTTGTAKDSTGEKTGETNNILPAQTDDNDPDNNGLNFKAGNNIILGQDKHDITTSLSKDLKDMNTVELVDPTDTTSGALKDKSPDALKGKVVNVLSNKGMKTTEYKPDLVDGKAVPVSTNTMDQNGVEAVKLDDKGKPLSKNTLTADGVTAVKNDAEGNQVSNTLTADALTAVGKDKKGNDITNTLTAGGVTAQGKDEKGNDITNTLTAGGVTANGKDANGNDIVNTLSADGVKADGFDQDGHKTTNTLTSNGVEAVKKDPTSGKELTKNTLNADGVTAVKNDKNGDPVSTNTLDADGVTAKTKDADGNALESKLSGNGLEITKSVDPANFDKLKDGEPAKVVNSITSDGLKETTYDKDGKEISSNTLSASLVSFQSVNAPDADKDGKIPEANKQNRANYVMVDKTGISNGMNVLRNVADGVADTDAATVGQVNRAVGALAGGLDELRSDIGRTGSMSAAMAAMKPMAYDGLNRLQVMAGVGNYKGSTSFALGLVRYSEHNRSMVNLGLAYGGSRSSLMTSLGATWRIGRGRNGQALNTITNAGLVQEVETLQAKNAALQEKMDELQASNQALQAKFEALMAQLGLNK